MIQDIRGITMSGKTSGMCGCKVRFDRDSQMSIHFMLHKRDTCSFTNSGFKN